MKSFPLAKNPIRMILAVITATGALSIGTTNGAFSQSPPQAPPTISLQSDALQVQNIERLVLEHPDILKLSQGGGQPRVIIGEPQVDKAEAQAFLYGAAGNDCST